MLDFFAEASVLPGMALHGTKVQKETGLNSLRLGHQWHWSTTASCHPTPVWPGLSANPCPKMEASTWLTSSNYLTYATSFCEQKCYHVGAKGRPRSSPGSSRAGCGERAGSVPPPQPHCAHHAPAGRRLHPIQDRR